MRGSEDFFFFKHTTGCPTLWLVKVIGMYVAEQEELQTRLRGESVFQFKVDVILKQHKKWTIKEKENYKYI